jgi:hypothetical protein
MCSFPEETLQEEDFANEFLKRDGVRVLVDVITTSHGNTLAVRTSALTLCLASLISAIVRAHGNEKLDGSRVWMGDAG